jgi:hypothetical protein
MGIESFAAGFKSDRAIHVFDTNIPGRDSTIHRLGKTRRSDDRQKGLISALAFPTHHQSTFAVGTYWVSTEVNYPAGTVMHGGVCVVGHGKTFAQKKRRFHSLTVPVEVESPQHVDNTIRWNEDMFSTPNFHGSKVELEQVLLNWHKEMQF